MNFELWNMMKYVHLDIQWEMKSDISGRSLSNNGSDVDVVPENGVLPCYTHQMTVCFMDVRPHDGSLWARCRGWSLVVVTNVQPLLVASYTLFCSKLILPIFHGVDSPIKSPLLLDVASIFCFLKLWLQRWQWYVMCMNENNHPYSKLLNQPS